MALRAGTQWWGVVLDAPNGPELAHFYARLLGWQVFNEDEDGAAVAPSEDAGYNLGCQTEKHYARPVWPTEYGKPQMSMHLDIEVDDLDEAVAYAVSVGAEAASYQPQETVRVMLDPAGHPFCLYLDVGGAGVASCAATAGSTHPSGHPPTPAGDADPVGSARAAVAEDADLG